jgi:hypothetical protein
MEDILSEFVKMAGNSDVEVYIEGLVIKDY